MKRRMCATVLYDAYKNLNFSKGGVIDARVAGDALRMRVDRILLYICAPLIMLMRLGDTPSATLSKLRKIVLWCNDKFEAVNEIMQGRGHRLESDMHEYWCAWMEEFVLPVADAAYVPHPQWINKSKGAGAVVMEHFWDIAKNCCKFFCRSI